MLGGRRVKTSHALSPPGASRPNPRRPVLLFCGLSPSALRLVTTFNTSPRLAALGSKPRVCAVPAGRLTAKPAATCTLVLRLVTFCSAACYHTSNPSPRLAALGSKPRVRCPRRAPHGKTRGDLYSCSVAVSPPQEVQPVIDASSTTRWHSSSWPRQVRLF